MFILPLVVAFVVTLHGVRRATLTTWSVQSVFAGKLLLAAFFATLAAAMAWLM